MEQTIIITGLIGLIVGGIFGFCYGYITIKKEFYGCIRRFPNYFISDWLRVFGDKQDKERYAK